ncbi:hypothetical protein AMJ57_03545 [Parcubacteria bacterium SG8_24]|nr:MAG: hypothetical protein AMJ57_03545 [Parcubacteria bacterium SG8_24]
MANPVLELRSVTKRFGENPAVKDLSLIVHPGETYGLIGPNGSGKTTTIKMIAGLYRPTSGRILVQGYDLEESPVRVKSYLGYIPDDPAAYDRLTGREFLEFVGEVFGMDRKLRDGRIADLLEGYGISDLAEGLFGEFSRGTKQKIAICAALLHDPSLLLIDEPVVGLDPESIRITKQLLKEFTDKGGAILMSTHTLPVAEELCQRFGLLKKGKVVAEGSKRNLRETAGLQRGSLEELFLALLAE